MANPYMPRELVHLWSEEIGRNPMAHQPAFQRLLRDQRRIARFIEENGSAMDGFSPQVTTYLIGVVLRCFDLAGGRLRKATWDQVRSASRRVQQELISLLPPDEGFPERVRAVEWRAQPHILDEALLALFERTERSDEEEDVDEQQSLLIFALMWTAIEVLDQNWTPPRDFIGLDTYTFTPVEVSLDEDEGEDEGEEPAAADEDPADESA